MKLADFEADAVYAVTRYGTARSHYATHGGIVYLRTGNPPEASGRIVMLWPVDGPPVIPVRGMAAIVGRRFTYPTDERGPGYAIQTNRVIERVCSADEWGAWWTAVRDADRQAAADSERKRVTRAADMRALVAALLALGCDLGQGPWDNRSPWALFLRELRAVPAEVLAFNRSAYWALAESRGKDPADHADQARAWSERPIY